MLGEPGEVAKPLSTDDEHLGLIGEVRPTRLDEIDQGEAVLAGDVHDAQRLRHRVAVHRTGLAGRVVGEDGALHPLDHPDAGDHVGAEVLVGAPGRQRRQLEERGVAIEEELDSLPGQELAPFTMTGHVLLATTLAGLLHQGLEFGQLRLHGGAVGPVLLGTGIDPGGQYLHLVSRA